MFLIVQFLHSIEKFQKVYFNIFDSLIKIGIGRYVKIDVFDAVCYITEV